MPLSKIRNFRKNGGETMYSRSREWKKKAKYRQLSAGYWYWQLPYATCRFCSSIEKYSATNSTSHSPRAASSRMVSAAASWVRAAL